MTSKRHKSYTCSFKLNLVSCAEQIRNRAAGCEFEIDEKCVHQWRAGKKELEKMLQQKCA